MLVAGLVVCKNKTYRERGTRCFSICGSDNKTRNKLVSFAGLRSGTAFQSCQMPFSVQERQSERAKCRSHNENGIELKCKCGSQTKNGISFFIVCGSQVKNRKSYQQVAGLDLRPAKEISQVRFSSQEPQLAYFICGSQARSRNWLVSSAGLRSRPTTAS